MKISIQGSAEDVSDGEASAAPPAVAAVDAPAALPAPTPALAAVAAPVAVAPERPTATREMEDGAHAQPQLEASTADAGTEENTEVVNLEIVPQEEARLAAKFGGVELHLENSIESDDEPGAVPLEATLEEGGLMSALDPEELQQCEQCENADGFERLGLSQEERLFLAADCRAACERALGAGDETVAGKIMQDIVSRLELPAQDANFFSEVEGDWPHAAATEGITVQPLSSLLAEPKRWSSLCVLLGILSRGGIYDARARTVLRHLARAYGVDWRKIRAMEAVKLAKMVVQRHSEAAEEAKSKQSSHWTRGLKVGGAAVVGGAALFLTGGLATPFVAAALGFVGAGSLVVSTAVVASLFGAAGAGLGGYKVARRTGMCLHVT